MSAAVELVAGSNSPISEKAPMIVFTICSRNFLGYALALWASLRTHHPDVVFHVGLCDESGEFDLLTHPFEVIQISALGVQRWDEMLANYDITELNTALKPFLFLLLFSRYPDQPIFYIDPDILVFSPFEEIFEKLSAGADCVLTPHVNGPSEYAEMNDQQFLRYGVYNMGFCVLRATPEVRRVVSWWARRLETQCIVDLENGLFVDQKWADLFPAYIERTAILRHPGYNVAYWNLSQRLVKKDEAGIWRVNGEQLRFFHFSGNKIEKENEFSRHSEVFNIETIGDVRELLSIYRVAVQQAGHSYYRGIPYAFRWGRDGQKNVHTPSSVEAERRASASQTPHLPVEIEPDAMLIPSRRSDQVVAKQRKQVDARMRAHVLSGKTVGGFCALCNTPSNFADSGALNHNEWPAWEFSFICEHCGAPSHVRAVAKILGQTNVFPMPTSLLTDHQVLLRCGWLNAQVDVGLLDTATRPVDLVALCTDAVGTELQSGLLRASASLRPNGQILLSMGGVTTDRMTDVSGQLRLLEQSGFVERRYVLYWSESLCHFGDPQVIVIARKPG